ncbi:MAG: type II toxin-antitoxin system CcdA family antitoxin [Sulfuricellaceae bacterium]|nr:type II toxin-antitoxin system CcdA family antitoxin [Sulfuricellaceae bacterium]
MKPASNPQPSKRPFNLLLNDSTVKQARSFTNNLSATVDALLADYVAKQNEQRLAKQNQGDAIAEAWNTFHTAHGSFADDFSTL